MDTGIIGGADGPTVVYIASSVNWGLMTAAVLAAAVGVAALVLFVKKKNRRFGSR